MKISNDYIASQLGAASNNGQDNATGKTGFADLLAEMVSEKVTPAQETCPTCQTQAVDQKTETELPELWYQVNGLLDTLDAYGSALADPGQTLKQIEPLVRSMEQQAESLENELNGSEDDSLTGLAGQAIMSAKVESLKFWRGDYIA